MSGTSEASLRQYFLNDAMHTPDNAYFTIGNQRSLKSHTKGVKKTPKPPQKKPANRGRVIKQRSTNTKKVINKKKKMKKKSIKGKNSDIL